MNSWCILISYFSGKDHLVKSLGDWVQLWLTLINMMSTNKIADRPVASLIEHFGCNFEVIINVGFWCDNFAKIANFKCERFERHLFIALYHNRFNYVKQHILGLTCTEYHLSDKFKAFK